MTQVFSTADRPGSWCALGSVKSQIGHTKAAAGAAGIIKAAMALHHQVLPPTIKVNQPAEAIAPGKTPFYVNTQPRPWLPSSKHPRRAGVSSFGFGGSNFHCVLEEYAGQQPEIDWGGEVQVLAFSADSREQLQKDLSAWAIPEQWTQLCAGAGESRAQFDPAKPYRLQLVFERDKSSPGKVVESARAMLDKYPEKRVWNTPDGAYFGSGTDIGKLAILFPGQGSQYVGCCVTWLADFRKCRPSSPMRIPLSSIPTRTKKKRQRLGSAITSTRPRLLTNRPAKRMTAAYVPRRSLSQRSAPSVWERWQSWTILAFVRQQWPATVTAS